VLLVTRTNIHIYLVRLWWKHNSALAGLTQTTGHFCHERITAAV